jgi:hypothetical protein
MKKITAVFVSVLGIALLLIFPKEVSEGIKTGLENSARLLVPSLFPFMVLSSFMIRSDAYEYIGKIFFPLARILRISEGAVSAVVLSFIGGFPVGAKCVRLLYGSGKIDMGEAERMMDFCVCSGPAFLITAVGVIMTGNVMSGVILYVSQIMSGLILGIISGFFSKNDNKKRSVSSFENETDLINAFIDSSADGARAIIELTGLVAIFSAVMSVIFSIGVESKIIVIFLEVTAACKSITGSGGALWMVSLAAGYGGMCVHFQIFALLKDMGISRLRFEIFRIANAFLSSLITYVICMCFDVSVQTFAISENTNAEITSTSIMGAVSLVVMSAIFLMSLEQKNKMKLQT